MYTFMHAQGAEERERGRKDNERPKKRKRKRERIERAEHMIQ